MSAHNLTDAEEAAIFGCSREEDVRDAINAILAARAAEADQDCTCRNDPLDNMPLIDVACPVHGMAVIRAERAEARSERLRGLLAKVRAEHEALWNQVDRDQHEAMEQLARAERAEADRDAAREQVRHMHDVLDRAEAERDEWMERAQGVKVGLIHDATEQITAERDAAEAKHRDLTSRLGFGDGITEPMADNDTIVEHWGQISSEAADHWECPRICELCGELMADTDCEHCNGSGCGPGTASGAYDECEWCAGVGRVHVGCAEMSYAELVAERDAAREALDHNVARLEDLRATLDVVKDRLDEFTYDEFAAVLDDDPCDEHGDSYRSRLYAAREALARVGALADEWASQPTDYDEDTEQQIDDGRTILAALAQPEDGAQ